LEYIKLGVMRKEYLENVSVHFPRVCQSLVKDLSALLGASVNENHGVYVAMPSNNNFLPTVSFDSNSDEAFPKVGFEFTTSENLSIYVNNITEMDRQNPSPYRYI